jgi:hypothetical protein
MWSEYKDILSITGFSFLQAAISIYIKTQAQVYIFGRMLEILNTNRQRNTLALLMTILFTLGYQYSLITNNSVYLFIWNFFNWFSMAILIYVLIGFDLFSMMGSIKKIKIAKYKRGE